MLDLQSSHRHFFTITIFVYIRRNSMALVANTPSAMVTFQYGRRV